jgi:hypothetical protein
VRQIIQARRKNSYNGLNEKIVITNENISLPKEINMGERGSKKDKNKAEKQKQEQADKKKKEQNAKLPAKKPA